MQWDRLNIEKPLERRIIIADSNAERDDIIDFAKKGTDAELKRPGLDPDAYRSLEAPVAFISILSRRAIQGMLEFVDRPSHPLGEKAQVYLGQLGVV
jgi:hypothetical protein